MNIKIHKPEWPDPKKLGTIKIEGGELTWWDNGKWSSDTNPKFAGALNTAQIGLSVPNTFMSGQYDAILEQVRVMSGGSSFECYLVEKPLPEGAFH